ncbi:MAG: mechanosensitive ion channel [Burkholderiales bacterium]|nr:mechanosensitive ion channel [Burkholderiales bacterium]
MAETVARDNAPRASTPPAVIAPITPIALGDILSRAAEDQRRAERATRLLASADPVDRLSLQLDGIARSVESKVETEDAANLRALPIRRLESLARHWNFDADRIGRWEAQARRDFAPYSDSALQLAQRRQAWSATRASGLLDGLPAVMSDRVDAILAQIDSAEAGLGRALARQFALTQRASELTARIQAGASDAAAAIEDIDRRLLHRDAPPLWRGLGTGLGTGAAWEAMKQGMDVESRFAADYSAADTANQQALRVLQLLLLPLILWLTYRSRSSRIDAAHTAHVAPALRRPVSSWLLLSMLGVLVLEPDAPLLVHEFALLLALVPVLRLLPRAALAALGAWPYVAIALYALDRLGVAAVADAPAYRLFVLAQTLLTLGATVWLLRHPVTHEAGQGSSLVRVLKMMGWLAVPLLAVSAVANVSGNVSLAEMLTSALIDSGYMALLLFAAVVACMGIVRTLLDQPEIAGRRLLQKHGALLLSAGNRLLVLAASLCWLVYALDVFRVLQPLQTFGFAVLKLGVDVGEVSIHVGDVLAFAVSVWLAYWSARAVRRLLHDELPRYSHLPRGAGNSIATLSYYGVLLLGLLVALSAAGLKLSQLTLMLGALGVGVGFGLQNVVNNFVSGLVLMFERPIQPGDMVETGGVAGTVREIGLRATTLRTYDGADVVVPNGLLLSSNLTNWTMFDRSRRFEIAVGVAYGSDPSQVLHLLESTARAIPGIAEKPAPAAQLTGYGDNALNFVLRAWTLNIDNWGALRSELMARVLAALQAEGIAIPYPQLDLHLSDAQMQSRRGSVSSESPDTPTHDGAQR